MGKLVLSSTLNGLQKDYKVEWLEGERLILILLVLNNSWHIFIELSI